MRLNLNAEQIKTIIGHNSWAEHPIEEWDLVQHKDPTRPHRYFYEWVRKLPKCACGKEVVPGSDLCEECNGSTMS